MGGGVVLRGRGPLVPRVRSRIVRVLKRTQEKRKPHMHEPPKRDCTEETGKKNTHVESHG